MATDPVPVPPSATPEAIVPLDFTPPASAVATPSCGRTEIRQGAIAESLDLATGRNAPRLPYVIADPPNAAGFLFDQPLRAGREQKILWVVGTARGGPLLVEARMSGQPSVVRSWPPNSVAEYIYPSNITMPVPGCWEITLRWRSFHGTVHLEFGPPL